MSTKCLTSKRSSIASVDLPIRLKTSPKSPTQRMNDIESCFFLSAKSLSKKAPPFSSFNASKIHSTHHTRSPFDRRVSNSIIRERFLSIIKKSPSNEKRNPINDFIFISKVGQGNNSQVWKVKHQRTNKIFALKEINKALAIGNAANLTNERKVMAQFNNQFLVNLHMTFQDHDNLYQLLDFKVGGSLKKHMLQVFDEETLRFFLACIIQGLEYVHNLGYIHRDLRPENLIFDQNGYLHLTGFGLASPVNTNGDDGRGQMAYMAPERVLKQPHSACSDYYSLGIIAYELITGQKPFKAKTKIELKEQALNQPIVIKKSEKISSNLCDLIKKLLAKKPSARLGCDGIFQIKEHPFFAGFQWDKLSKKLLASPYYVDIDKENNNCNEKNILEKDLTNCKLIQQNHMQVCDSIDLIQLELFQGYEFQRAIKPEQSQSILFGRKK